MPESIIAITRLHATSRIPSGRIQSYNVGLVRNTDPARASSSGAKGGTGPLMETTRQAMTRAVGSEAFTIRHTLDEMPAAYAAMLTDTH